VLKHLDRHNANRGTLILFLALTALAFSRPTAQAQNITLTGVVKSASGQPLAGAFVKVRNADLGVVYMVVTQTQGRYSTPELLPGKYTVQGFGGGYQSEPAGPVELRSGQPGKMDLVLSAPQQIAPRGKRRTTEDYLPMMPEGDAKTLVLSHCTFCHSVERIVPARVSRDAWEKTVGRMNLYLAGRQDLQKEHSVAPMPDEQVAMVVDYLTKNFGTNTPPLPGESIFPGPNDNLPATLPKGPESKFVAMELDQRGIFNVYDVNVDSRGGVWVSGRQGTARTVGKVGDRRVMDRMIGQNAVGALGRFDPKSMSVISIPLPPGKGSSVLGSVAVDPEDNIWISDRDNKSNHWYEYKPKTNEFETYEIPPPLNLPLSVLREPVNANTIRFLDGNVWGVGNPTSRVIQLDPSTGKVTQYPAPMGSHPHGIAIGGDKAVWYVAIMDQDIVRLDPHTGKATHYKTNIPLAGSRMTADRDGNLWTVSLGGKLLKVDYRTGKLTVYDTPSKDPNSFGIDADTKRNLIWFDETDAGKIARFDPRTNRFAEFPLPSADMGYIVRVIVDPTNSNRVWWSSPGELGYVEAKD
jgi:streptogramin lyase